MGNYIHLSVQLGLKTFILCNIVASMKINGINGQLDQYHNLRYENINNLSE